MIVIIREFFLFQSCFRRSINIVDCRVKFRYSWFVDNSDMLILLIDPQHIDDPCFLSLLVLIFDVVNDPFIYSLLY